MKYKASLSISVVFENFSVSREDIRKALKDNVTTCVNRGLLTEGIDSTVEDWAVSVEFEPVDQKMKAIIEVKALYEDEGENRETIRSTIEGLADYMASRGYLSDEVEVVDDWFATAEVELSN